MPTFEQLPRFDKDFAALTRDQQQRFIAAVMKFADLDRRTLRAGLRVKRVEGAPGIFEMTWAPDGRATFEYGAEVITGEPRIIWRGVGGHDVFGEP